MTGPPDDGTAPLGRAPLDAERLAAWAAGPGSGWREVRVVASTGSTNADLAALAAAGEPAGLVLAAEEQTAGRGRLGRSWVAPPRAGLAVSVLLRPARDPAAYGWLPLLAGLAVAEAVTASTGVDVRLKWPNDLIVGERKLGGVLSERLGTAVVVGVGVNVSTTARELPVPQATSLAVEGVSGLDRTELLRAVLARLGERVGVWDGPGGDPSLADAFRARCATLGLTVRAELPGGTVLEGVARAVDDDGRLVVATDLGDRAVAAGDVVHVRSS